VNTERPENDDTGASGGEPENWDAPGAGTSPGASGGRRDNAGAPGTASASGGQPEDSGAPGAGNSAEAGAPNGAGDGEERARDAGAGASADDRVTDAEDGRRAGTAGADGAAEAGAPGDADGTGEGPAPDTGDTGVGTPDAEGGQLAGTAGAGEAEGHRETDAVGEGRTPDAEPPEVGRETDAEGLRRAGTAGADGAGEAQGHGDAEAAGASRAPDAGGSEDGRETDAEGGQQAGTAGAGKADEGGVPEDIDADAEGRAPGGAASEDGREADAEGERPAEMPSRDGAGPAYTDVGAKGQASVAGVGAQGSDGGAGAGFGAEAPGRERGGASELGRERDDARRGGGRRRSPAVVASVAAAVLLVGGGGAYLAANASGGPDGSAAAGASGGSTPPPLRLDGATEGGAANGIAPGEPNPYGVRYRAGCDLPDGPGAAPVYRASGQVGADDVERLAEALGVDGTPVSHGQTWHIGVKDGTGPTLQVDKQAPGAWTFQRFASGSDDCRGVAGCAKTPSARAGDPPAEDAAKKAAEPVLEAAGQDEAKLDASQVMGAQRVVHAEPVVDGLPTHGWTTGVTVNAQGEVVGGSGLLAAPVKGDTYPVLSAEKTLGLMNETPDGGDGRGGIGGCADPVPLKEQPDAACDPSVKTKKDTVTVEKAVFGLAAHAVDGRQALVPSWLFQVRAQDARDRFTVTYPAVDPAYLATPSEEPTTGPSPRPSGPKDDPSASPVTRNVTVEGYTAEGRDLTVTFTGGVCAEYDVTASESGGTVTVRVTETTRPEKVCILIAKVFHRTVRLDAPLGDRRVVGTDGQGIPLEKPGARLPATPQMSGAR